MLKQAAGGHQQHSFSVRDDVRQKFSHRLGGSGFNEELAAPDKLFRRKDRNVKFFVKSLSGARVSIIEADEARGSLELTLNLDGQPGADGAASDETNGDH